MQMGLKRVDTRFHPYVPDSHLSVPSTTHQHIAWPFYQVTHIGQVTCQLTPQLLRLPVIKVNGASKSP